MVQEIARTAFRAAPNSQVEALVWQLVRQNHDCPTPRQMRRAGSPPWRLLALSDDWSLAWSLDQPAPIRLLSLPHPSHLQRDHERFAPAKPARGLDCLSRSLGRLALVGLTSNRALPRKAALAWVQPARLTPRVRPSRSLAPDSAAIGFPGQPYPPDHLDGWRLAAQVKPLAPTDQAIPQRPIRRLPGPNLPGPTALRLGLRALRLRVVLHAEQSRDLLPAPSQGRLPLTGHPIGPGLVHAWARPAPTDRYRGPAAEMSQPPGPIDQRHAPSGRARLRPGPTDRYRVLLDERLMLPAPIDRQRAPLGERPPGPTDYFAHRKAPGLLPRPTHHYQAIPSGPGRASLGAHAPLLVRMVPIHRSLPTGRLAAPIGPGLPTAHPVPPDPSLPGHRGPQVHACRSSADARLPAPRAASDRADRTPCQRGWRSHAAQPPNALAPHLILEPFRLSLSRHAAP